MKKIFIFTVITMFFSVTAFSAEIMVTVSIAAQKYVVDKISGGKIKVNIMVDKSSDPHAFSPKASQVKLLEESSVYLGIGFPFEDTGLSRVAGSMKIKIVKTDEGIEKLAHDRGASHHDPHIWTSPANMKKIAENTFNALKNADPANSGSYESNYKNFLSEIDSLDNRFKKLFEDKSIPKTFLVYHPTHSYFAGDYGLTQLEVEQDGKAPKPAQLKEVIDSAKKAGVRLFLVQPNQSPDSARVVSNELKIPLVTADILNEDWLESMKELHDAFSIMK